MKETTKETAKIAVIGGSGLYEMQGIAQTRRIRVKTPFGNPSGPITLGTLQGVRCAFLPRHGRGHRALPSEINGRANIWALKSLGVERIIAAAAVGSLKEELAPRHFVFPDQLIDETKGRRSTFFGDGIVAHVSFADPFCAPACDILFDEARRLELGCHRGGVYVCMEGPAFSTKAESAMHRMLGCSIIGMTVIPEAKLAREAEICYAPVAMVTDYDCWKDGLEVSLEQVLGNLAANVAGARALLAKAIPRLAATPRNCPCAKALRTAVVTEPRAMGKTALKKLKLILAAQARREPGRVIKP